MKIKNRMKFNIELKKGIYKKQGNTKGYREELKNLILFFNDTDIEDYIELRSCYNDKEWIKGKRFYYSTAHTWKVLM